MPYQVGKYPAWIRNVGDGEMSGLSAVGEGECEHVALLSSRSLWASRLGRSRLFLRLMYCWKRSYSDIRSGCVDADNWSRSNSRSWAVKNYLLDFHRQP